MPLYLCLWKIVIQQQGKDWPLYSYSSRYLHDVEVREEGEPVITWALIMMESPLSISWNMNTLQMFTLYIINKLHMSTLYIINKLHMFTLYIFNKQIFHTFARQFYFCVSQFLITTAGQYLFLYFYSFIQKTFVLEPTLL